MITLSMIINTLNPYTISLHTANSLCSAYRGIYLADGSDITTDNLVYIGDSDTISRLLIGDKVKKSCLLISAGDSEMLQNAPLGKASLITTSLALIPLYNQLSHTFMQCEDWESLLLESAKKGIRNILKTASSEIGFSIVLLNTRFSPIAQQIRSKEEVYMQLDLDSSHNPAVINLMQLLEQQKNSANHSVFLTPRKDGLIYALCPVLYEHSVFGYLFACSSTRSSILHNIMYILSQIISRQIKSDNCLFSETDTFQSLAVQFLNEQTSDLEKLELRLHQLSTPPKKFMRGIVIRQIDNNGTPELHQQMLHQLFLEVQRIPLLSNAALLDDCIYIMTSNDKPDSPITIDRNPEFEQLLQKYNAFAMVSNHSQRLRGVRTLFRQCFQILPIAVSVRMDEDSDYRCMRFDRYSPYYIIYLCEKAVFAEIGINDILYLCHPAVLTLTRYDRAFNNNLRDTLFCFLINDRSISATSRKMFMHRNTTIYKLEKIQDLIHDDLSNPYTRHQLILSCMIIRYAERYLHSPLNLPPLDSSIFKK